MEGRKKSVKKQATHQGEKKKSKGGTDLPTKSGRGIFWGGGVTLGGEEWGGERKLRIQKKSVSPAGGKDEVKGLGLLSGKGGR